LKKKLPHHHHRDINANKFSGTIITAPSSGNPDSGV
jgi:hypothetical protein